MRQIVILDKEERDAVKKVSEIQCNAGCIYCPLNMPAEGNRCLVNMASRVLKAYKTSLNAEYGILVTKYVDTDSIGEQINAQSGD